jgi:ZIP family zinc transporter
MPTWLQAGLWGLLAGSALVIGAAIGYFVSLPRRIIAGVMAFGGGVLISALSFDLMDAAYRQGGFDSTSAGFLGWRRHLHRCQLGARAEGREAPEAFRRSAALRI